MTTLTPSVFDFVDEYVDELASRDELPADLDEEEALVLFTREFFTQFFSEVFGYQILAFDAATAVDAWVAVKQPPSAGSATDPIVSAFRAFCQDYATIIGEHYDRGDERSDFQREFVPSLLENIHKWAVGANRGDLADAAGHALDVITDALAKVEDST